MGVKKILSLRPDAGFQENLAVAPHAVDNGIRSSQTLAQKHLKEVAPLRCLSRLGLSCAMNELKARWRSKEAVQLVTGGTGWRFRATLAR